MRKREKKDMKIRERSDIPVQDTWALEAIFATDADWEAAFEGAQAEIKTIVNYQNTLGSSPDALLEGIKAQNALSLQIERIYTYACMRRDQDNGNSLYSGMADRAGALAVEMGSACSFFIPEILAIDEKTLRAWSEQAEFASYRHEIDDLLRSKAHILSHAEERLLAMAGEVIDAPHNTYRMMDYADLHFPSVSVPGEGEVEITHGNFIHLMENHDRALRAQTFERFYSTYKQYRNTYASTLSASVKGDIFTARARNYPSALEAALYDDNVPPRVYDSLIEATHENLPAVHRYMELRKRILGLDEVHMYDIYAPLSEADFSVSYEQAQQMVIDGLAPLGDEYGDLLRKAFSSRWIDVYENRGKTSGAYSWGCYGSHPFVLLNYQPGIDSVFTIAHELGHSLHTYYSDTHQEYHNAQYRILVAEVASTVNESLLMRHLLNQESDPARRLRLLNYYCEQFRTTVYRQVMFAEFEKLIHEMSEGGESLTADELEAVYGRLNVLYYGDKVVQDEGISIEWARISHFYNAFYVYKYATGFSSAVALSDAILTEGQPAMARYKEFLCSGGSDYPLALLQKAGVDLTRPEPVDQALRVFEKSLDELEALVDEMAK